MATTEVICVKAENIEPVVTEWKKYFTTGKEVTSDFETEFLFSRFYQEQDNETHIFCKGEFKDWISIKVDLGGNLYQYDEILRRISQTLNTTLLLTYYQSTSGEGRIVKFEKGFLIYSFYQRYYSYEIGTETIHRIYLADNFGMKNSKLQAVQELKYGQEILVFDYDFLNDFNRSENVSFLWDENSTYLHLEIIF